MDINREGNILLVAMEQSEGSVIPLKHRDQFCRNVILLKNGGFERRDGLALMPTASELSNIKKPRKGQFKKKCEFHKSWSEVMTKEKLEKTFPYLEHRRFSCAAVVKLDKDSSKFEFYGSPRPWDGKTIRSKIKGNSALYILEDEASNSEMGASTNILQGCDDDSLSSIASVVHQISLLDDSQMEIESQQAMKPRAQNVTLQSEKKNRHQEEQQMFDSLDEFLSSFDNATSSGIISGSDGAVSEDDLHTMVQWLKKFDYEVSINPRKSPLEGGAPCTFTFDPELSLDITSVSATFGNLPPVELEKLRFGFLGKIPASPVPGCVPVILKRQDDFILGQIEINYYGDEMEDALQKIVVDLDLQERLFSKFMSHTLSSCSGTSGGDTQSSRTFGSRQLVRVLSFLVYAAAKSGAQQFVELIFNSSTGRVVYDTYKNNSTLPESVAKDYGNKETADYLEKITKRFSEEIGIGQELSQTIDWSELAAKISLGLEKDTSQLESDFFKETGYLGDIETSWSELESSNSEGCISTMPDEGSIVQDETQLKNDVSNNRNEDKRQDKITKGVIGQEEEIPVEKDFQPDNQSRGCKDQLENNICKGEKCRAAKGQLASSAILNKPQDLLSKFMAVVAIDFGTTSSGFAFSFGTGEKANILMHFDWTDEVGSHTIKTPTCLLLKPDLSFDSFGYDALERYESILDESEEKKYLFFSGFKMALHNYETLNNEAVIKAANGRSVEAHIVFACSINFLKEEAVKRIRERTGYDHFSVDDIQWVLTVPTIWTAQAKQFMRKAAYEAGVGSPENADQLIIALESEAAELFWQKKFVTCVKEGTDSRSVNEIQFKLNTPYIVADIGGGILDVVVHEMTDEGAVKEIHKATGGPYGGIYVNQQFERLLDELFGAQRVQSYRKQFPSEWVGLMNVFESKKQGARILDNSLMTRFWLPHNFLALVNQTRSPAMKHYGEKEVIVKKKCLFLSSGMMKKLFFPVVESIKKHLKTLMKKPPLFKVQTMFLAGGFADCAYLREELMKEFSGRCNVLIPHDASIAVLQGAVIFGTKPAK